VFGKVSTADVPVGLGAIKALPWAVWLQIGAFCLILEVLTENPGFGDRVPDRVPGNLQPDTPSFAAPGDLEIRTKEINNARLAMISIWGLWVGEIASGGVNPYDVSVLYTTKSHHPTHYHHYHGGFVLVISDILHSIQSIVHRLLLSGSSCKSHVHPLPGCSVRLPPPL